MQLLMSNLGVIIAVVPSPSIIFEVQALRVCTLVL